MALERGIIERFRPSCGVSGIGGGGSGNNNNGADRKSERHHGIGVKRWHGVGTSAKHHRSAQNNAAHPLVSRGMASSSMWHGSGGMAAAAAAGKQRNGSLRIASARMRHQRQQNRAGGNVMRGQHRGKTNSVQHRALAAAWRQHQRRAGNHRFVATA